MTRPLLLDLFSGAGGATRGYQQAGFHVVGVDINPQPRYCGDGFHQTDALEYLRFLLMYPHSNRFAAIHASPPCQHYSAMTNCRPGLAEAYPDLVESTRRLLNDTGLPWVIENVEGADVLGQPNLYSDLSGITLCGHMFGLKLYRHRLFESNIPLVEPPHPRHLTPASKAGHWVPGTVISICSGGPGAAEMRQAMGISWMNRDELSEAIPPQFTAYIGRQLIQALEVAA